MDFEPLRDAAHPAGPRWAPVELDREDALNAARHLIIARLPGIPIEPRSRSLLYKRRSNAVPLLLYPRRARSPRPR